FYSVPWSYLSQEGVPEGFYVDALREAAKREKLDFEMVLGKVPAERALATGTVDVWAAAVPTEERRKNYYFTEPWWTQNHFVASLKPKGIRTFGDLAG